MIKAKTGLVQVQPELTARKFTKQRFYSLTRKHTLTALFVNRAGYILTKGVKLTVS